MAVYQNEGQYGFSMRDDAPNNHDSMSSTLQAEDDKIYEDPESNKLFLDNLKPIPEDKRVNGGPDHQLNGSGILRATYGDHMNGEIARKKVARLVSKKRFEEIERMPAKEQNAEVQKITHGYSLTDTPVDVGGWQNTELAQARHNELKGMRNLSALDVKTNQQENFATLSSGTKNKYNTDISLTYNPKLNSADFNPDAAPTKYGLQNVPENEFGEKQWSQVARENSLNGGTAAGGTPDGISAGGYAKRHFNYMEKNPSEGNHEYGHTITNTIDTSVDAQNLGTDEPQVMKGFSKDQGLHLSKIEECTNALGLFKAMMARKYGISVQNASHLKNFYEEFWKDKQSDTVEDKSMKESIRKKIPTETRRLFDLMDHSNNLKEFYQNLDDNNIMNQVRTPKAEQSNDVDYRPSMWA